jgi:succinate dehydrogenase/fumarate reductase flavoprotein subunit
VAAEADSELTVDVLVVGSGNGGLTAALCAYELGVESVLVVEKSDARARRPAVSSGFPATGTVSREAARTASRQRASSSQTRSRRTQYRGNSSTRTYWRRRS